MTDVSTVVPGADLASFLAAYPPFDHLDEPTRSAVAATAQVDAYAAGQLVLDAFTTPSAEVYVVLSGRVELWDDQARIGGPPDENLGPGGLFGFSAMLTERSVGPRAVAAEASTVARIPEASAWPVFTSRDGARYLAGRLAEVPVRPEVGPTYSTVDELVRTAPLVVLPDATVAEVARTMTEQHAPYAVVALRRPRLRAGHRRPAAATGPRRGPAGLRTGSRGRWTPRHPSSRAGRRRRRR